MFREVRRKKSLIPVEEAKALLSKENYGVLAVNGDEGYPYCMPLNYVYVENTIYFHCAVEGHKLDSIKKDPKVSFCVYGNVKNLASQFDTDYISAVAFGKAEIVENEDEKQKVLEEIIKKYSKDFMESGLKYVSAEKDKTKVVKITIEHISGKKSA